MLAATRDTGSFRAGIGTEGSRTPHALSRPATIEAIEALSSRSKIAATEDRWA
jgi:hypothetical protein